MSVKPLSEATLQYHSSINIHFSLIYALFAESSIDAFKEMCTLHGISIKMALLGPLGFTTHPPAVPDILGSGRNVGALRQARRVHFR